MLIHSDLNRNKVTWDANVYNRLDNTPYKTSLYATLY